MSLLGLPAEIIENIVSYLSISDICNLKLSCYDICEKIGDYSIDIGDDYFTCNIKNYEKIAKQDKILLLNYIKKNVIKY